MSKRLAGAVLLALVAQAATAQTVGVSMARFDAPFLTALRAGMQAHAAQSRALELEVEDARNDDGRAFLASDERQSGTLEAEAVCRLLKTAGKGAGARVLLLTGELTNRAARQRTEDSAAGA